MKKQNIKDHRFELKKQLEAINTDIGKFKNLVNEGVFFDEKEHVYTNRHTGEFYAGVSEILNVKNKGFMAPWAALETAKYLGWEDEAKTKEITEGKWTYKQWQDLLKSQRRLPREIQRSTGIRNISPRLD